MKPYYEDDYVTLYHGDCLDILPKLEKVDLVLIDPPYIHENHGGTKSVFAKRIGQYQDEVDSLGDGFDFKVLDLCKNLMSLKNNFYIFCSRKQLIKILDYVKNTNYDILTYIKTNPTPTCNNHYLSDTEYIVYSRDKGISLYGSYQTKKKYFLQENGKSDFNHPTVKPLNIIQTLISNSTKKGGIVLDCFAGSGTTGVACKQLKRKCILIEKEEKYCDIIVGRLQQEYLF